MFSVVAQSRRRFARERGRGALRCPERGLCPRNLRVRARAPGLVVTPAPIIAKTFSHFFVRARAGAARARKRKLLNAREHGRGAMYFRASASPAQVQGTGVAARPPPA